MASRSNAGPRPRGRDANVRIRSDEIALQPSEEKEESSTSSEECGQVGMPFLPGVDTAKLDVDKDQA